MIFSLFNWAGAIVLPLLATLASTFDGHDFYFFLVG